MFLNITVHVCGIGAEVCANSVNGNLGYTPLLVGYAVVC